MAMMKYDRDIRIICTYAGCGRRANLDPSTGYCPAHIDPANRRYCACGAEMGMRAKSCRPCGVKRTTAGRVAALKGVSRDQLKRSWCKPITPKGLKYLRQGRASWASMVDDDQRECRIMHAKDLVTLGLLTEEQSRQEYPSAWDVIDRRKASNMMEVE